MASASEEKARPGGGDAREAPEDVVDHDRERAGEHTAVARRKVQAFVVR